MLDRIKWRKKSSILNDDSKLSTFKDGLMTVVVVHVRARARVFPQSIAVFMYSDYMLLLLLLLSIHVDSLFTVLV